MIGNYVVKNIPRTPNDQKLLDKLSAFSVATLAESQGKKNVMDPGITPVQNGRKVAGKAVTVQCFDSDNLMIHAAVELCRKGDFLVVSTLSETRNGYFGELMARSFQRRGVVGLVMDGGVRDVKEIREMDFPVWTRYVNVVGTSKKSPGSVNVPVVCGNVAVGPGDFVVADDDGIVVIDRNDVGEVMRRAEEREERERETRRKIDHGELSLDFYGLRKNIGSLGIEYLNDTGELPGRK